ncbi:major facilitator superfamily transporter [Escherichia coli SHECO001]|uniref:MFS transporter n=3 Tax=Escherichia coli TaxID=562 RepID=UPI000A184B17|nr:MFS transporter [Escherichia coli]OSK02174.1 major facilitator superfamily transporter [Escherichia coli SHECO001]
MPEPVAEPALNGLRLNLRIVSIVMFNFASYLTIGLPLAVLPGYVHDVMGFSAFWAGLVISLQYFATLLSRPHAGRYADLLGPKKIVVFGLCGCFLSGLGYLTAGLTASLPVISLLLLCLGRVILGIGQSFAGTGSTLWGVGVVGSLHIGRVISWNGIVTYGAMAMGAPLGVVFYHWGGLQALALIIMGVALVAILLAIPRPTVKASKGKPLPFRAVLGRVWLYGMALALASAGFGVIATFITLFYDAKGWDGAAFALTLFSCAFVGTRLLFPNGINRIGGLNVAMICFSVEIIGLLLVGVATMPWMAKIGVLLAGAGFSLVFPALGVVAVKAVPQQNQGAALATYTVFMDFFFFVFPALGVVAVKAVPQQNQGAALATYTVFMDLSLGVTGPLAGLVMSWAGVPVIYLAAAGLVTIALLLTWRLKKRPPEHVPEAASSS